MTPSAAITTDPVDAWLASFHQAPNEAVDRLLMGRVYLGSLERNEVHENLFRLFLSAPRRDRLVLDDAVYNWFFRRLLAFPDGVAPARWADIFRNACAAVVRLHLEKTATYLHQHYAPARDWLRALYQGPARDPEAALLRTLAFTQRDRNLFPLWMHLCRLEEDCPWDYAALGLLGLLRLPDEQGKPPGGLNHFVFAALRDMAEALARRVQPLKSAQEFWIMTFKALVANPFPRSDQFLKDEFLPLIRPEHHEIAADWLGKVRPRLRQHLTPDRRPMAAGRRSYRYPSKQDFERIQALITGRPLDQVRSQIQNFIKAHERYAQDTGDPYFLVPTFDRLAGLLIPNDLEWALRLVEEAFRWAPRNTYLWMRRAKIEFHRGRLKDASCLLWQARREFPENKYLRTFLADILKAQGRLEDAELLYRQDVDDFSNDVVCRTNLAEVLKAQGRLKEAELVYRQAVDDFPNDVYCHTTLGGFLKAQGRLEEAELIYRQAVDGFPDNVVCRTNLAEVLKAQGRLEDAEIVYRQAVDDFPNDPVCRTTLAEFLRAQGRLEEAELVYRQAVADFPNDVYCRTTLGKFLKAEERLEEAEIIYRQAVNDFPNDPYAIMGFALVLMHQHRLPEARQVIEVAASRFPNNTSIQGLRAKVQADSKISNRLLAEIEASIVIQFDQPYTVSYGKFNLPKEDDFPGFNLSHIGAAFDESLPLPPVGNGAVNEQHLGLAQLYRLASRRTDSDQLRYQQQSLKIFDAVLAQQATQLFALLGKGFVLLDADPVAAETFFVNLQEKGVNRLGFSLGHIRSLVLQGKPVPPSDWSALRERFPASRNLTRLAQSLAELHHPNGRTIKVLNDLRSRLPAPDADLDRSLESLPRDLWNNEAWIIRNIHKRLLSNVPSDRPIEKDDLPAILENYQKSGVALHGLIEQSLAIDSRR